MWFLAGTFGGPATRECSIPAGKQLFFPLVNRWCVFPPEYYGGDAELIAADIPFVEEWFDASAEATCSLTLRVDGQDVRPDLATLDEATYIRVVEPRSRSSSTTSTGPPSGSPVEPCRGSVTATMR